MPANEGPRLVADVGGTNTRIALYDPASDKYFSVQNYVNRNFVNFEDVVEHWLGNLSGQSPEGCSVAIASPLEGDQVDMVNMDWSFSRVKFAQRFAFQRVAWLNDFEGNAHALPHLQGADLELLNAGQSTGRSPLAVMGPGTGLGGATLDRIGASQRVRRSEPGSMGISPQSELELALFELLLKRHKDIYAELLISGPGLYRLYVTLCELAQTAPMASDPAEVSRLALTADDEYCLQALTVFCELLGSACGDFILANGAYGGLYLAGGILPKMTDFLKASRFHLRLCNKGFMAESLGKVPVYLINGTRTGLIGAAHAPLAAAF
ncbi:MAG: glucokinase [Halieaceae bacterium]|jgi:glucokinase